LIDGLLTPALANQSTEAREQYATQLVQLNEMGFYDEAENLRHLIVTRMSPTPPHTSFVTCSFTDSILTQRAM